MKTRGRSQSLFDLQPILLVVTISTAMERPRTSLDPEMNCMSSGSVTETRVTFVLNLQAIRKL